MVQFRLDLRMIPSRLQRFFGSRLPLPDAESLNHAAQ